MHSFYRTCLMAHTEQIIMTRLMEIIHSLEKKVQSVLYSFKSCNIYNTDMY